MGIDPESVEHLCLAQKIGLGTCDLGQIEILGEPISEVKKNFKTL